MPLLLPVLALFGFGPLGPIAGESCARRLPSCSFADVTFSGSFAAAFQSIFGVNIVFSILQSVAMGGAYGLGYLGWLVWLL